MASIPAPSTMRGLRMDKPGGPEQLVMRTDLPTPAIVAPTDVRIAVKHSTATYTDLLILSNSYRPKFPFPVTPGYDLVGVVESVGPAVTTVAVGDLVAAMPQHGSMATYRVLPEEFVYKLPSGISLSQAVCLPLTGVTAYQMLHRAGGTRLSPDAAILVHGCVGGTGAMVVALAKISGVKTIIGTCSARNMEAARAVGVMPIDYAAAAPHAWPERVKELTGWVG